MTDSVLSILLWCHTPDDRHFNIHHCNLNLSLFKLCLTDDRNLCRYHVLSGIQNLPNVWVAHPVHHFTIWFFQYTFSSLVISLKCFTHMHVSASNEHHWTSVTYFITTSSTYSITRTFSSKGQLQIILMWCILNSHDLHQANIPSVSIIAVITLPYKILFQDILLSTVIHHKIKITN